MILWQLFSIFTIQKEIKTGVIVPIEIWNEEEMKVRDDNEFRPQDFRGTYKNRDLNLDEEIRFLRDEWVREC